MLNKIKFYNFADKIREFEGKWVDYNQKLVELLRDTQDKIKSYKPILEQELYDQKFEFIETSLEALENKVPILPYLDNKNVLYTFAWDAQTPFFTNDVDKISTKFEELKKLLAIANTDSLRCENNRCSRIYSPNKKKLPYCHNNGDLFKLGQYCHMSNQQKAHLGLLVTKPHHDKSIDCNTLSQWFLENYINVETRDKVRKTEQAIRMLSNDTIYQRLLAFQLAFNYMIFKTLCYPLDSSNGMEYSEIFISINPIMNADDHYINALKEIATEKCQHVLTKHLFDGARLTITKFTVIQLKSTDGFIWSEYFSPSKSTAAKTKDLVI